MNRWGQCSGGKDRAQVLHGDRKGFIRLVPSEILLPYHRTVTKKLCLTFWNPLVYYLSILRTARGFETSLTRHWPYLTKKVNILRKFASDNDLSYRVLRLNVIYCIKRCSTGAHIVPTVTRRHNHRIRTFKRCLFLPNGSNCGAKKAERMRFSLRVIYFHRQFFCNILIQPLFTPLVEASKLK